METYLERKLVCVLMVVLSFGGLRCDVYYCMDYKEVQELQFFKIGYTNQIKSNKEGKNYYRNNQECYWKITTAPDRHILLTVVESNLQWAPVSAICDSSYDYMEVNTTSDPKNSTTLAKWCGKEDPGFIISKSSEVFIKFSSNSVNPYKYKGITLNVTIFRKDDCPPGWIDKSTMRPVCFGISETNVNWYKAFTICNQGQSNLAKLYPNDIIHIQEYAKRRKIKKLWLGLNDIKLENNFVWLDETSHTLPMNVQQLRNSDSDCVYIEFTDEGARLITSDCIQDKHDVLCEVTKGNVSELYLLPQLQLTIVEENSGDDVMVGVGIGIGVFILIIIVVVVLFKCGKKPRQSNRGNVEREQENNITGDHFQPSDSIMTQSEHSRDSPPSYEEAISKKFNSSVL